jgi:hypothetical protein
MVPGRSEKIFSIIGSEHLELDRSKILICEQPHDGYLIKIISIIPQNEEQMKAIILY